MGKRRRCRSSFDARRFLVLRPQLLSFSKPQLDPSEPQKQRHWLQASQRMINLKQLYRAIQASQYPKNLGDFAILKADALGARIHPSVAAKMQSVVGYYPTIDLEALSQLPDESFGREYAHHMQENHLTPFNVSPELDDVAQRNVFALRYAVTHDIFHVLLGFDIKAG